jgi:beta-lactamase superfamily II metal-dependent hydrolase
VGGWTFLHLSELGEEGQKALLESGAALNADIVIAGMPERGEPLSDALLESVQPKVIIMGTAEYPFTAQGSPSLRERLRAADVETYYINEEQAVTITVNPAGCSIRSMRGRRTELQKKAKEAD